MIFTGNEDEEALCAGVSKRTLDNSLDYSKISRTLEITSK